MQITRNTLETSAGPGDWLTGTVFIDSVTAPSEASPVGAAGGAFHPRGAHCLAQAPARSDDLGYRGPWPVPAGGRPDRGDPAREIASSSRQARTTGMEPPRRAS